MSFEKKSEERSPEEIDKKNVEAQLIKEEKARAYSSFQGRSESEIRYFLEKAAYLSKFQALNRLTEKGRAKLSGKIMRAFLTKEEKEKMRSETHRVAIETSREVRAELADLIEEYANAVLTIDFRLRAQRGNVEVAEFDRRRKELHDRIKVIAKNNGISDKQILALLEMRVEDRIAESGIKALSERATEATDIPLQVNDDDLVLVGYQGSLTNPGWRLPKAGEMKNTYSLVYRYIFQPHDSSCYEFGPGHSTEIGKDNLVPKERIDYASQVLQQTASELASKGVSYFTTNSHYVHDDQNYPEHDDFMAFRAITFVIKCRKEIIEEVIQTMKANSKVAGKNSANDESLGN